ncbi:MAG: MFS transporter [Pseudomonadota bacterium]|nr:MFS transporter [Pseudomonadota bacterium]
MSQPGQINEQTAVKPASLEQSGSRFVALTMFGLLLLAYVLMSADRYLISILAPDVRKALGFSLPQMGALTTLFTLGIGIAGLPAGSLIARYSRKTVLLTGILLFSGATFLFTVANSFFSMLVFIVMQGVGMSFLATSLFSLAASYFANNRVAAVGIVNVCFGLGSFVGPWAIGDLRSNTGSWQAPMLAFAACGIGFAVLIALVVRPWFSETKHAAHHNEGTGGADSLLNRNTIILTALSVMYGLAVYGFLGLYPTFLRESLHFTPAEAGAMLKFFGLGSLLAYFAGMLGDRLSPKVVIIGASVAVVLLGLFLYLPDLSTLSREVLVFLYGVFGAAVLYTNLAGAHIKSLRRSLSSRGSSMFVTTLYAGAAFGGFLMGGLVKQFDWIQAGRIQISLLTLLGALLALGLRPSEMSK